VGAAHGETTTPALDEPIAVRIPLLIFLAIIGVVNLLWGFHVKGLRTSAEERFTRRLISWMTGQDPVASE
jgi:hypothetical protein